MQNLCAKWGMRAILSEAPFNLQHFLAQGFAGEERSATIEVRSLASYVGLTKETQHS